MAGHSTYQVTLGARVFTVTLRRDGEVTWARIDDGPERQARLTTERGTLRTLVVDETRHELFAERKGDDVALAVLGVPYEAAVQDARRARLASVTGSGTGGHTRRELKSPMPGLVVQVACQVGATIAKGQPLVVLQAMKMENELSLPFDGVVKAVSVKSGQTVEQGQVLVVLE